MIVFQLTQALITRIFKRVQISGRLKKWYKTEYKSQFNLKVENNIKTAILRKIPIYLQLFKNLRAQKQRILQNKKKIRIFMNQAYRMNFPPHLILLNQKIFLHLVLKKLLYQTTVKDKKIMDRKAKMKIKDKISRFSKILRLDLSIIFLA